MEALFRVSDPLSRSPLGSRRGFRVQLIEQLSSLSSYTGAGSSATAVLLWTRQTSVFFCFSLKMSPG